MSHQLYVHAALGREGLGNLLVPWARAEVFRRDHQCPMLAPQWTQPKIGPLLRLERDKRYYVGLFDNSGYVRGLRKRWILGTAARVPVAEFSGMAGGKTVVIFRWNSDGLFGLGKNQTYIRERLMAILSPRIRGLVEKKGDRYEVAVHVRRGDRPPLEFGRAFSGDWLPGMPDGWFVNCIESIRSAAGRMVKVRVFSDAKPGQIDRILSLPGVELSPPNPSIVDMVLMSRCKVLITTGTSTFSAWSSLLGGPLTLYYPGLLKLLRPDWSGGSCETDLAGRLDDSGTAAVRGALAQE